MDASWFVSQNILLQNSQVVLRPLQKEDLDDLLPISLENSLWDVGITAIYSREDLENYIDEALHDRTSGVSYPFVVINPNTKQVVGCTRFYDVSFPNKRLSIGFTWLSSAVRGTGLNKAKKFEMLQFAFETLQMNRVEFRVDALNLRSRRAIQKIGATEEGILRKHTLTHTGRYRDTVVCSILDTEWPHLLETVFHER